MITPMIPGKVVSLRKIQILNRMLFEEAKESVKLISNEKERNAKYEEKKRIILDRTWFTIGEIHREKPDDELDNPIRI